jgi:hypothetical protein
MVQTKRATVAAKHDTREAVQVSGKGRQPDSSKKTEAKSNMSANEATLRAWKKTFENRRRVSAGSK